MAQEHEPSGCISRMLTCVVVTFIGMCLIGALVALTGGALDHIERPRSGEPTKPDLGSEAEAWAITRQFVTDKLRSPATADFPWSPTGATKLGPGKWRIAGYVDSQNAFGATLRTEFAATVETRDGTKWSLLDLQLHAR